MILAVEGGDVLERCQLNWEITGLLVGTIYAVRVQAYTSSDMGETGTVSAVSSTYGLRKEKAACSHVLYDFSSSLLLPHSPLFV